MMKDINQGLIMGYITTFSIYNDGIDLLEDKENREEFLNSIVSSVKHGFHGVSSIGRFSNFLKIFSPKHSSDFGVYVHLGNTVTDLLEKYGGQFYPENDFFNSRFGRDIIGKVSNLTQQIFENLDEKIKIEYLMNDCCLLPMNKLSESSHNFLILESFKPENKDNKTLKNYIKLHA